MQSGWIVLIRHDRSPSTCTVVWRLRIMGSQLSDLVSQKDHFLRAKLFDPTSETLGRIEPFHSDMVPPLFAFNMLRSSIVRTAAFKPGKAVMLRTALERV